MSAVETTFREGWGRVLAAMVGYLGDLDLAEDVTQEAFVIAAERWERDGAPPNPVAWLITTARNRALNRIRRDKTFTAKAHLLSGDGHGVGRDPSERLDEVEGLPDERLELLFLACHPALSPEAQVAMTLRAVGGLTTPEIAAAFLVPEQTMAQRIVRAKRKVAAAGIPFRVPRDDLLAERLDAVLTVIYLVFNQGYSRRTELAEEAIRLGRVAALLLPDEPEVHGLVALMLMLNARRAARFRDGELVMLADQDWSLLAHGEIEEGRSTLARATGLGGRGPYVLQAAIASLHADPERDWAQIAALYAELARITRSPVVELNRAVAVAEVEGPQVALEIVDRLDLDRYHYVHATRAELLRRLGRDQEARSAYEAALELVDDDTERRHLKRRCDSLGAAQGC